MYNLRGKKSVCLQLQKYVLNEYKALKHASQIKNIKFQSEYIHLYFFFLLNLIYIYILFIQNNIFSCYFTINLYKNLFCFMIRKSLNTFVKEEKVIFPTALLGFLTGVL